MEEISWHQKSRIAWLKGDKNTRFFHKIANMNGKNNYIDKLLVDDEWVFEPKEINDKIVAFYRSLWSHLIFILLWKVFNSKEFLLIKGRSWKSSFPRKKCWKP